MRKFVFTLLIVWCALVSVGIVYAQEFSRTDCSLMADHATSKGYADSVYQFYQEVHGSEPIVYTLKDLETAHRHLKQYCCEASLSDKNCSGLPKTNNVYAQSPYMFDHLMNIGMRKMDGVQDHCDEMDIDCQREDGSRDHIDWREEVTEIAQDREGHPSYELEGNFREYWGQPGTYVYSPEVLYNRYNTLCDEAVKIREVTPDFNAGELDAELTNERGLAGVCKDLSDTRYYREYLYVRALMVEKAILYQSQNMRSYVSDYFTKTRLKGLLDKYAALDGCFNMVLKYVRRTDCCNL